jgi:hypothetical protein
VNAVTLEAVGEEDEEGQSLIHDEYQVDRITQQSLLDHDIDGLKLV